MKINWSPLQQELRLWRAVKRTPTYWWRDDDAIAPTPNLDKLMGLAEALDIPAHLAIIPKHATAELATLCKGHAALVPLVHGWAHENHAPEGDKRAEFNDQRPNLMGDAQRGFDQMSSLFGTGFLPCFVPPWNRINPDLIAALADMGYTSLSTFTPRKARLAAPHLVQINTHIDPIIWRGGGGLIDPVTLVEQTVLLLQQKRLGILEDTEPLGLLTHHLVHSQDVWTFTDQLLKVLMDGSAKPLNLLNIKDTLP